MPECARVRAHNTAGYLQSVEMERLLERAAVSLFSLVAVLREEEEGEEESVEEVSFAESGKRVLEREGAGGGDGGQMTGGGLGQTLASLRFSAKTNILYGCLKFHRFVYAEWNGCFIVTLRGGLRLSGFIV